MSDAIDTTEDMSFKGRLAGLRSGPMWISWSSTSARALISVQAVWWMDGKQLYRKGLGVING